MKSVIICGSNKFAQEAQEFGKKLEQLGVVVYMPHFYTASGGNFDKLDSLDKTCVALGLTHDHFYKIRQADVVFVFNKNGYSGYSTTMEIGYAVAQNKTIYALEKDTEELCKDVLFKDYCRTPEELQKCL